MKSIFSIQWLQSGLFGKFPPTLSTGLRRPIGCLKLQVTFRKRATNSRALLRKMACKDKASFGSSPPCTTHHWRHTCWAGFSKVSLLVFCNEILHLQSGRFDKYYPPTFSAGPQWRHTYWAGRNSQKSACYWIYRVVKTHRMPYLYR